MVCLFPDCFGLCGSAFLLAGNLLHEALHRHRVRECSAVGSPHLPPAQMLHVPGSSELDMVISVLELVLVYSG